MSGVGRVSKVNPLVIESSNTYEGGAHAKGGVAVDSDQIDHAAVDLLESTVDGLELVNSEPEDDVFDLSPESLSRNMLKGAEVE
ncbi:hypothetical protein [Vibrio owensii]|uniref:hypothetical protein n=1 Tax=Vibrio owensii TaxID=696485 RepID=UPI0018F1459E|nr:hypothetical protein [Vibrio owensii]